MITLNDDLKNYYRRVTNDRFIQISRKILSWEKLKKWHRINLVFSDSDLCYAELRSFGDEYPMVLEISFKLLHKIDTICYTYEQSFIKAYSAPKKDNSNEVYPISSHFLRNCLFDTTLQFIISHELSHVLCGHMSINDEFYASVKKDYGIDNDQVDKLIYYILEMDADGTASNMIYWGTDAGNYITNTLLATAWIPEVNHKITSIHHLKGIHLELALRIKIMVKFIAFTVLEQDRKALLGSSHPLPASRLLCSFNTIGLEYSFTIFKDKKPTFQDKVLSMFNYNAYILKPVMMHCLEVDRKTEINLFLQLFPENSEDTTDISQFFKEYLSWCTKGVGFTSVAIKELESTRELREIIDLHLKPYRYLDYMGFNDLNKL